MREETERMLMGDWEIRLGMRRQADGCGGRLTKD